MDFAQELQEQMNAELEEELQANRQSFQFGRRVERLAQQRNRLLSMGLMLFYGFVIGLVAAGLLTFWHSGIKVR